MLSLHVSSCCPAWANTRSRGSLGTRHIQFIEDLRFSRTLSGCFIHSRVQKSSADSILCNSRSAAGLQHEEKVQLKEKATEMVDDLRGTCIYLVGMIGSGKSAVGKCLAKALGYYFFDSDKLIEEAAGGRSVSQLIEEEDEDSFRDAETEILKQLSCMGRLVVATGGETVLRPINWSYLRYGVTVWLDVPVETLAQRAASLSEPLSGITATRSTNSQDLEELSSILNVRGRFYADADATVSLHKVAAKLGYIDVNMIPPETIALEVLEEIEKLMKSRK